MNTVLNHKNLVFMIGTTVQDVFLLLDELGFTDLPRYISQPEAGLNPAWYNEFTETGNRIKEKNR
ncbi:hypothetical protein K7I13_13155 [Brucepastera parasyntrophica]|uniref:hypothetical protein n=1 Tax=Brucepastera parasyntrophica TaxID=2880008 RepID=UPI00210D3258|nr:hypothetical protein [Brucepastera parasyntrophica]ULQ59411.1 hypothetical protein K7I13_13155 [Brucepastera parasyntrophica]